MSIPAETGVAASAPCTVLFDFDGVLVHGDSFSHFLWKRFRLQPWRALLLLPTLPLAPMALNRHGRWWLVRWLVRVALLGLDQAQYRAVVESHARVQALRRGAFLRDAVSSLRRHLLRGDRVVIVTGCEEHLARALLDAVGLDDIELVASQLRPGVLGMRSDVHNVGAEKVRQLARHGIAPPWACAYSDAGVDLPILAAAEAAVLVNPDAALRMRMQARLGDRYAEVDWG